MPHQGWVQVLEPTIIADETKIQPNAETAFWVAGSSPIIPKNMFITGTRFRLYTQGQITTGASNNSGIRLRLRWSDPTSLTGGVQLVTRDFVPSLANSVTNGMWEAEFKGVCRSAGASGSMWAVGEFRSEAGFASFSSFAATITLPLTAPAVATVDTTADKVLVMTASGASSNVSFTTSQIELSIGN